MTFPPSGGYPQDPYGYPGGHNQGGDRYAPGGVGGFLPDPHDPLIGVDIGQWFSRSFDAFKRSWKPLLAIAAVQGGVMLVVFGGLFAVGFVLVAGALARPGSTSGETAAAVLTLVVPLVLVAVLVGLAVSAWGQVASFSAVIRGASGRGGFGEAAADGARRFLPMLGWSIVAGLLTLVGAILCLLPGIVVAYVAAALVPALVLLEPGGSVWDRAMNLPRHGGGFWGRLAVTAVSAMMASGLVRLISQLLTTPITLIFETSDGADAAAAAIMVSLAVTGISLVVNQLVSMFVSCLHVTNYVTTRYHESGGQVTTPVVAAVLP